MKIFIISIFIIIGSYTMAQTNYPELNKEIKNGNYSKAKEMITKILNKKSLSEKEKNELLFELERHERIRIDFKKTKDDIIEYIKKYIPEVDEELINNWEEDGSLEFKIIDGEKLYFNRSHTNFFRINKKAKKRKDEITKHEKDGLRTLLKKLIPDLIKEIDESENNYGKENKIKLSYKLSVPANTIPSGKVLKAWLPFPKEGHLRQEIESFNSIDEYKIADNSNLQRSVYFEKITEKNRPTIFSYELILKTKAVNFNIDPKNVKPFNKDSTYRKHTSERYPHIVFTEKIKNLSKEIVKEETNPYLIAKNIFTWISKNIPWAGAREYSTILNIPDYCLTNMHGDCGIKTLLFMTLARYNGIPTKWQSGWMLHPGEKNLHDWCEAYFEGYGWVPVDQSFGIQDSNNPKVQYFYLGGIDQYRFIVNDDYSQPFSPNKIFPRSETVDFQRGEVEWTGGNLYFDKWDYSMQLEYLK